ncbi:hypothetical protein L1987_77787 [Smallanthus sonchifolius]|uniref:Uncharacterized protein n=1 Tax=Smallanthus sonchifolius TaxID=185202 RepID=A0ACB8ZAP0_9ASTR|nr:hypothetical protein L1987_77787 [Smallanthus sonchifolius]
MVVAGVTNHDTNTREFAFPLVSPLFYHLQVIFVVSTVAGCLPFYNQVCNTDCVCIKGGRAARRAFEFGRTYVVKSKGKHQATIVWLHGLGDNGSSWSQLLETLPLPNIKWICPTSPAQPLTLFGGFPTTAWFDVSDLSEDAHQDEEGMDASAAHVLSLLSTEPPNIKLGVGGFSMGAAQQLLYTLQVVLPMGSLGMAIHTLLIWMQLLALVAGFHVQREEAANRASSLPILLCHGKGKCFLSYVLSVVASIGTLFCMLTVDCVLISVAFLELKHTCQYYVFKKVKCGI